MPKAATKPVRRQKRAVSEHDRLRRMLALSDDDERLILEEFEQWRTDDRGLKTKMQSLDAIRFYDWMCVERKRLYKFRLLHGLLHERHLLP